MRGHKLAGTSILFQRSLRSHSSKKNPRRPNGVDINISWPLLTASIGRKLRYNSSETREASSMTISDGAEKPLIVPSLDGRETTREPFCRRRLSLLSSVNFG